MAIKGKIKHLTPVILFMICMIFSVTVYAEETLDGSKLTYEEESTGEFHNVLRGAILDSGRVTITNKGNCQINCYGNTSCFRICDRIELNIYLERSSGSSWSSYTSWKYSTTDDTSLGRSNTITVPGGYYYRLRGYHACEKSGYGRESNSSFTDGIWIS